MNLSTSAQRRVEVVDSHTAGEPTRVIVSGGPDLGSGDLKSRLHILRTRHDCFRSAVVCEPRGSEVVVGALLTEPAGESATAAVIFFNDVGYLGMCGHGTMGVIATLAHLGRIAPGRHDIETPVGTVRAHLHADHRVSVENVPSYVYRTDVAVEVRGFGTFQGDIAWGGNWFFLVSDHTFDLDAANRSELLAVSTAIRAALRGNGITGRNGATIDHIELCGPAREKVNSGRNFVLCPGASFDRSPCGTGTSAKMACLHAAGQLPPGTPWLQEGILGTVFEGSVRVQGEAVIPTITGRAWITAESTLLFDPQDPFPAGIALST
ncbi:MAG TPA: proline racemase family protein [Acidobacteriaceae bacterium]|nr:proline racemase family protein [Acidobacteriaceae bacterium]